MSGRTAAAIGTFGVSELFRKPDAPKVIPPPRPGDPAVQAAVAEAARRRQRARGFRSTILGGLVGSGGGAGSGGQPGQQQTLGA